MAEAVDCKGSPSSAEAAASDSEEEFAGSRATRLPRNVLLDIASRLGPPRRNVQAMRSSCPAWRAAIPSTNGPMLMLSRLDDGYILRSSIEKMLALQMVASEGGAPKLVRCPGFCRTIPPPGNPWAETRGLLPYDSLWGAAYGLAALQQEGTTSIYLFCLNCGENNVRLPTLPVLSTTGCRWAMPSEVPGTPSGGVFFHEIPSKPLAILFAPYLGGNSTMFHVQEADDGYRWWSRYPGLDQISMSSIGFLDSEHFVAVTADRTIVLGPVKATDARGETLVFLDIPAEAEGAPLMAPWGNYGNHVFKCGDKVHICIMLRSVSDEHVVSCSVYYLNRLSGGRFALVRTRNIGDFAVYLGANQALVYPAAGSNNRLANTIYIPDDDGVNITARIWQVNIASGAAGTISFPPGVFPRRYGRATWASPPPPPPLLSTSHSGTATLPWDAETERLLYIYGIEDQIHP